MKTKGFLLLMAITLLAIGSFAQEKEKRFGFEFNGGASFATRELGGVDLKTGLGFEGLLHYRFMPHLGIYAGWGWNKFSAENTFAGDNVDFEETGYVIGLQFKHEISSSSISYYLRAAALYNHIELEIEDLDKMEDTGHGLGFQIACGVSIPIGSNWSLTPGLKFNALSREIKLNGISTPLDLNYLSVRLGIAKTF